MMSALSSMLCFLLFLTAETSIAELTVGNYTLISSKRVTRTEYEYTYRATVTNSGQDAKNVTAEATSASQHTTILEGTLEFGDVAAGTTVTSIDTMIIKHNRSYPLDWSTLHWEIVETTSPVDSDGDGLIDSEENSIGTNPQVYDTDGDGYSDGLEVKGYSDPLTGEQTWNVGPAGGAIQVGRFKIAIPAGVTTDTVEILTNQIPSQSEEMALSLDPIQFKPIGPGLLIKTPFSKACLSLSVSYDSLELPPGYYEENIELALRAEGYPERITDSGLEHEQSPVVQYVPLPTVVDSASKTVSLEICGGEIFQPVVLSEPLETVNSSLSIDFLNFLIPNAYAQQYPFEPYIIRPLGLFSNYDQIKATILEALEHSDLEYSKMGFPTVHDKIIVEIVPKAKMDAFVAPLYPNIIILGYPTTEPVDPDVLKKAIAHEYFHIIQAQNSNSSTFMKGNNWFSEGTACWASDEIYDDIPGNYFATPPARFLQSLNCAVCELVNWDGGISNPNIDYPVYHYWTVAFWKWLYNVDRSTILSIIQHHNSVTHVTYNPIVKNDSNNSYYLDSLKKLYPNLDFNKFVLDSLYLKDYDIDETLPGDLWTDSLTFPEGLGPPKTFSDRLRNFIVTELEKDGPGHGEDNKVEIDYFLRYSLSASPKIIKIADGNKGLSGTLVLKFDPPPAPPSNAADSTSAIIISDEEVKIFTGLNETVTHQVAVYPGSEVVVIMTTNAWEDWINSEVMGGTFYAYVDKYEIKPKTLSDAVIKWTYTKQFEFFVGEELAAEPVIWDISGRLPDGITFHGNGLLSGTPTELGEFPFSISATDQDGSYAEEDYVLKVVPSPVKLLERKDSVSVGAEVRGTLYLPDQAPRDIETVHSCGITILQRLQSGNLISYITEGCSSQRNVFGYDPIFEQDYVQTTEPA